MQYSDVEFVKTLIEERVGPLRKSINGVSDFAVELAKRLTAVEAKQDKSDD